MVWKCQQTNMYVGQIYSPWALWRGQGGEGVIGKLTEQHYGVDREQSGEAGRATGEIGVQCVNGATLCKTL